VLQILNSFVPETSIDYLRKSLAFPTLSVSKITDSTFNSAKISASAAFQKLPATLISGVFAVFNTAAPPPERRHSLKMLTARHSRRRTSGSAAAKPNQSDLFRYMNT
jgi:hypothetical protein